MSETENLRVGAKAKAELAELKVEVAEIKKAVVEILKAIKTLEDDGGEPLMSEGVYLGQAFED